MKKALRIIVPILMILVVLGSIAWYLLIYDSDFTQEMLLKQARRFEENGNHSAAVWVYNLAYSQSGEEDAVAIELANQFKAIGNYTKAEYTLSNAIADKGTVQLYLELCKTYLEQDKLLDVVRMLDTVQDPQLKAELDALRPASPVPETEPGFYNTYETVDFQSEGGTLYVTTDGTFPSLAHEPFAGSITLPAGETTIYALVVAENGLVSPVSISTYTVLGVIEEITFQDPTIEEMVRSQLNYSAETVIHTDDLWTVTELTVPEEVTVYSDLAGMINLTKLSFPNAKSGDFSFLNSLRKLESLEISGIALSADALNAIASSVELRHLSLDGCSISSIAPLSSLHELITLNLNNNSIRDLSALGNMQHLETLLLKRNAVNSLGVINALPALRVLDLSSNDLTSIATIGTCVQLEELDISENSISDIKAVGNLKNLTSFRGEENQITDVSPLSACLKLKEIDISGNTVADISLMSNLTGLMYLDFSNNTVTELPLWPMDCALVTIDGSYNQIATVEPLKDFYNLNRVNMDYNPDLEDIEILEGCPALVQVDAYGTKVTEVSALTARSIIVNFDPTLAMEMESESEDEE